MPRPQFNCEAEPGQCGVDAPYSRPHDWWKTPEKKYRGEHRQSQRRGKRLGYFINKTSKWTITYVLSESPRFATPEAEFQYYAARWKEETGADSSLTSITENVNYLKIIKMGRKALPFIFKELQLGPSPWFVALRKITGEVNVGRGRAGNFKSIAADWVEWGVLNGYC
jgi:hypothetical protein